MAFLFHISDSDLRAQLKKLSNNRFDVPVTRTTRRVLLKVLGKLECERLLKPNSNFALIN